MIPMDGCRFFSEPCKRVTEHPFYLTVHYDGVLFETSYRTLVNICPDCPFVSDGENEEVNYED